jgi:hypothetical protein
MKQFTHGSKIAFLLLVLALPVVAGTPTITFAPFTGSFIPAAQGCGFDVLLTPQAGRPNGGRVITFSNGNQIAQGPLFITATNQANGVSISKSIGPAHFLLTPDSLTSYGAQIDVFPAALAEAAGLPPVSLSTGKVVETFDAEGNLVISFTGTADDLCKLLE